MSSTARLTETHALAEAHVAGLRCFGDGSQSPFVRAQLPDGHPDGHPNGLPDGHPDGHSDGHPDGHEPWNR
jgi:hypothetical protein